MNVLVINPGSTSTKAAVYDERGAVTSREFRHERKDLSAFSSVMAQADFRLKLLREILADFPVGDGGLHGVAGRGGLLHPLPGGVYEVSDDMLEDLSSARYGEHPCNLGAVLARRVAAEYGVGAYIVDPVVTDELDDVVRMTGIPGLQRRSLFHALSHRGAARTAAARLGVEYEESDFIVCHMGGGISIGAHRHGRVVDVVNALDGEGPFSPERTGGVPLVPLLDMLERGERTPAELREIIQRRGGMYAHLGTNDLREVLRRMEAGDGRAEAVFKAMTYSVAKYMASLVPALADRAGQVNLAGVVLTGGLVRSGRLVAEVSRMTRYLGPVEVVEGDEEMATLADGVLRVLSGRETVLSYRSEI
ncbi:butyrate kinase [Pseudodesulfovibrio sp.]|uniref:butyrate kinase n=1 Tax=unclassified Pseudodesulfovibrio TaxID=2661612 RepID=UPI003B002C62